MPRLETILFAGVMAVCVAARAQVTNTTIAVADAFVCTGSPNYENGADLSGLNFGAAGTLVVASSAASGEFQSVVKFNLADSVAAFNLACGSNNWTITGISLDFASNYGTAGVQPNNPIFPVIRGGQFVIEWLSADDWIEGTGTPNLPTTDGITLTSLPGLLAQPREILATNTYSPPGNNVRITWPLPLTTNLVTDICAGGDVTFRFYAADNQIGYLFNSYKYGRGNEPKIDVVVTPALKILSGVFVGGAFQLNGVGNNNSTYNIQVSTNLTAANWHTIGAVISDGSGTVQFADTNALTAQRFYRLSQ